MSFLGESEANYGTELTSTDSVSDFCSRRSDRGSATVVQNGNFLKRFVIDAKC